MVLVRVITTEGMVGIAEAPVRQQIYGETHQSIVAAIQDFLSPMLIGMDVFEMEAIHAAMDIMPANNTAKAAIDIALHDLIGKKLGMPLWRLLGGYSEKPVQVSWMVAVKDASAMADECARMQAEHGINAFKIKSGIDPEADFENFSAIRNSVGDKATLYIDGNQGYTLGEVVETVQRLAPLGLAWVEEPCKVSHQAQRKQVAKSLPVPVLGDESCFTPEDVCRELAAETVGIVSVKVARTGFYKSRKIINLCEQAGIPCLIGSQGDSSIGAAAALHLAAAYRNIVPPAEVSYHLRMTDEVLKKPLGVKDGAIQIPDGPGLGIEIDEAVFQRVKR